ncbi:MAG: nitroreductase family protein [Patescibacteria group bacterium]|nr:nitroreductase family protein [Patescibacteria group bacterium]
MPILNLIKKRKTTRQYKRTSISECCMQKIIEAGIWGPSVPSFLRIQPWYFVATRNHERIERLADITFEQSKLEGIGVNLLLRSAAQIIRGAKLVVLVYNSNEMKNVEKKYKNIYQKFKKILLQAENSAIAASVQNMLLVAEDLGVGACWLDTPIFCEDKINKYFSVKHKNLNSVLTFGYSKVTTERAPRKSYEKVVNIIR